MPYCPQCGSETEEEAAFCGDCGVRLEEQAPVPPPGQQPPTPRPAARGGATPWSLFGSLVVLGSLALGLVALYDAAANDSDWGESIFGGGGGQDAIVAAPSPTPEATDQPTPAMEPAPIETPPPEPTATPLPDEPTATPIFPVYLTPEEAIAAFFAEYGEAYVGDCADADLDTDIGSYCSVLWEDEFDTRIYAAGLTFSEPDTWLLVSRLGARDDWTVVDFAEFPPAPEEPIPPWP